ncbi:MAG: PQQ-binding-like beta-propeller repeat protein [Planctomycetes bacterium]|nr:PQQ-binding-like beta-propeller repeat protein [Planctomycetota bacterium]
MKRRFVYSLALLLGLSHFSLAADGVDAPGAPATWPQWRGPRRDGKVTSPSVWPDSLSGDLLVQTWRIPLEPSYSGPVVSDTLVFTTETKDKKREVVRALDRKTGQQQWEASWDGALSVPFFAKSNGDWIRSTPAYDGESLFVAGMRDVLVCLDARTGEERWQVDFVKVLGAPLPAFGFVCSPLVDGESVYVQAGAALCKLDKRTGKILWRSLKDDGGMWGSAFSSPFLTDIAGRRQLLVQTREKLAGVDPETGAELWSQPIPAFRGMNILTPTVSGETVFTSSYGGKSLLFQLKNDRGTVSATEAWTNKATGYMSSPVVIDGYVYLHLQNQRFTCIDLATGKSKWTTQPYGKYWSLVANGDRILALDERGELLLIRANPEKFELLDSRKLSESPTWAHLAICGQELFIRELKALSAYRWRSER